MTKSTLEQALLQVQTLEEIVNRNSKEILATTMKQDLNELLKESMEDEDELPVEDEDSPEDEEEDVPDEESGDVEPDNDSDDESFEDEEDDESFEDEEDDEDSFGEVPDEEGSMDDTLDMTNASDGEVLKVFRAMKPEDGIVVKKDGNKLEFTVDDEDYIIKLGDDESEEDNLSEQMEDDFGMEDDFQPHSTEEEDPEYEEFLRLKEKFEPSKTGAEVDSEYGSEDGMGSEDEYGSEDGMGSEDEYGMGSEDGTDDEEQMYEIELGDDNSIEGEYSESVSGKDPFTKGVNTSRNQKSSLGGGKKELGKGGSIGDKDPYKKGANSSRNQKSSLGGGKKELGKGGPVGDTNPFEKKPKGTNGREVEVAEASRSFAFGNRPHTRGDGTKKKMFKAGRPQPNGINEEVETLKKQNGEYRKALILFKDKLNEVAVFNANLAYATRLFTEGATTKQEKLNILKRFDSVSTIKESKTLYTVIKNELGTKKPVNESVVEKIASTPKTSTSKEVLSESNAYQDPQYKRMKELMKIIK